MMVTDLSVEIDSYLRRLFPLTRSLTGDGNRQTLNMLQEIAPIEIIEYPSGTEVYDWIIPDEWIIRDAYIKGPDGSRLVDFGLSNLHVLNYSESVYQKMDFHELAPRLHVLEKNSEVIPYRTSYYARNWGFCVTGQQFEFLRDAGGLLEVCIDSEFNPSGSMTIGELRISGVSEEEYLVSTYCCHPSMANDNLSGLLMTALLARNMLALGKPNKCWRFIFVPETIGAIAYLCNNEMAMKKVSGGFVITTCGGPGPFGYKETFLGNHTIDRAIRLTFRDHGIKPIRYPFVPDGSDERQYSSPGFRIPVATITRDKYYEYPEYHTSADDLNFVTGCQIEDTLSIYLDVLRILDENMRYRSRKPYGEPQLGKAGLYPSTGGALNQPGVSGNANQQEREINAISWLLFLADGERDLLSISEQSGVSFADLFRISQKLISSGLIAPVND